MLRKRIPSVLLVATLTITMPAMPASAQSSRYVLTSVEQTVDVGNWQITAPHRSIVPPNANV